jgi:hypothetical protein
MADFFKGLSGGFGTGLQFGQAMRERNMREELAQAYAKPETFQGYTAEQGQQLEAMANAVNPETGRPYYNVQAGQGGNYTVTPDFTESQIPRTGVDTGSQYGVAPVDLQTTGLGRAGVVSQPIPFNQQQVQEYGGRRVAGQFDPEQLRGLQMREAARVLGSYGDPARAAQLEAEATRMEREAEERPLRLRNLQQQIETGDLTIDEKKRLAEEQANIGKAREELRELRAKGPLTAAAIADVSGRYKLDPTTFLKAEDAVNTIEIKDLKRNLSTAALKGEAGLNQFLADKFDPDKTDNIKPMITKAKDGSFVVSYGDRVLEEYGAHKNMMSLVGGVINIIDQNPFDTLKTLSTLETQAAQREESKAGTKLKTAQAGAVGLEKLSPLEKNLATLKRLNIPVTDAQIKTMALGVQKDPALEAELAAITKIAGSDTANPKVLEALPGQIQAALARSKGRETAAAVVSGLTKAQEAGKGAEAIAELRNKNMPEPAIQAAAMQAGIPYTAPAQPTQPAGGGLTTGAQPAPYVPPAGSPAAIAAANRAKGLETNAETQRIAMAAQQRLADQFASDARTLSPAELSRKYDTMRGQLPVAARAQLQQIERNIR